MNFGIANVAGIVVICYLVGLGVKNIPRVKNELIPVIVGVVGGILGAVALATKMPDFPANDYITAVAVGIVSGLSATGADQIAKQLGGSKA